MLIPYDSRVNCDLHFELHARGCSRVYMNVGAYDMTRVNLRCFHCHLRDDIFRRRAYTEDRVDVPPPHRRGLAEPHAAVPRPGVWACGVVCS